MASVTIASVKKNFGEVPILHGVDIDIKMGLLRYSWAPQVAANLPFCE